MSLLITVIVLALIFDFINGFHDAANSIATVVSTKVLSPGQAVLWAAFFNFLAYWVFHLNVADTIAKTVDTLQINLVVILAGVIAAIIWNLLTWWFGIPSSSSHTLVGGFAGAAVAHAGFGVLNTAVMLKIISFIVFAPVIGMLISYLISLWFLYSTKKTNYTVKIITLGVMAFMSYLLFHNFNYSENQSLGASIKEFLRDNSNLKWLILAAIVYPISILALLLGDMNVSQTQYWFRKFQLVSSAAFSLGHGGNDSQKVMGIIAAAIIVYITGNHIDVNTIPDWLNVDYTLKDGKIKINDIPSWVALSCYTAIAVGTMSGGWKIVKTMGSKITKVTPFEGVAAETAGAITLYLTEHFKIPVSTTHTITGAIIGVGITKRVSAVRWGVTVNLLWAWVLTIPVSAVMGALIYFLCSLFHLATN